RVAISRTGPVVSARPPATAGRCSTCPAEARDGRMINGRIGCSRTQMGFMGHDPKRALLLAATLFAHESAMLGVHGAAGLGDAGCLGSGLAGVTWVACYLVSPAGCSWAGLGVSRLRVCRTGARAGSVGLGGVS